MKACEGLVNDEECTNALRTSAITNPRVSMVCRRNFTDSFGPTPALTSWRVIVMLFNMARFL